MTLSVLTEVFYKELWKYEFNFPTSLVQLLEEEAKKIFFLNSNCNSYATLSVHAEIFSKELWEL